ncbi:MAG: DUF58 domain-containing protein, partial [Planctomycetales bacterium]|nr:DUF58 domain-containing protein [Planctomycetales bacterium]
ELKADLMAFTDDMSHWVAALQSYPAHVIGAVLAPVLLMVWLRKAYPSRTFVLWAILPCCLTLGVLFKHDLLPLVLAIDLAVLGLALIDGVRIPAQRQFEVTRECQRVASLRKKNRVQITIVNFGARAEHIRLRDELPDEFAATPEEFELTLPPNSRTTVHYDLTPSRRGAFRLEAIQLCVSSRFGFWNRYLRCIVETEVNVYPDMKQLGEYAMLARTNRLNLLGVRRTRQIGQDNEFERLRDYTLDDNFKHIDWRSTARRNKLTVKDFQTNQSQRVVFLLDCGRMMTNEAGGLSLLDHALNSMLMLSYVALSRGDSVGLVTFSDQIHSSVPARSGQSQMNHLLHAVYDRFPRLVESRYEDAFLHISSRFRKRSLVVLVTNVIDEVNARQIHQYLNLFTGRHLPMAVLLRDHRLFDAVDQPIDGSGLYRAAAAAEILTWRNQVITDLQHKGVLVVDTFPEAMTAPLINRYLEIKARHLL